MSPELRRIAAQAIYGTDRLKHALKTAAPGVLDPRSWHYWHHRLGLGAAGPQTRAVGCCGGR